MKSSLFTALTVSLLVVAHGTAEDAIKAEKARLRGTWKVVSVTTNGDPAGKAVEEKVKDGLVVITDDEITFKHGNKPFPFGLPTPKHNYQVDPARKPKSLVLTPIKPAKGSEDIVPKAIYSLKADELRICYHAGNAEAPPTSPSPSASATRDSCSFSSARSHRWVAFMTAAEPDAPADAGHHPGFS